MPSIEMNVFKRFLLNHKEYFSLKVQTFSSPPKDLTEEVVNSGKKKKMFLWLLVMSFSSSVNLEISVIFYRDDVLWLYRDSGDWRNGFKPHLCYFLALWPGTIYLAKVSLSFLLCKMRMVLASTSQSCLMWN